MSIAALSGQNDLALTIIKQSAQSAQALADLVQASAETSKALLALGSGGNLDISV